MDKLNIDFKSLLPYVIDAFSSVYGEEYRSIISKRINNCIILSYHDVDGLNDYVSYLKRCKGRELSIRFLDKIGIDVQTNGIDNYAKPLDKKIRNVLDCLIDSSFGFSKNPDYWAPLLAFDSSNKSNKEKLLENKIKIINYFLNNSKDKITYKNFESFTKTDEYLQILKKINEFKIIYKKLLSEFYDWEKQLAPYEKYIEDENKRKDDILQKKKNELFREIVGLLPLSTIKYNFKEQINIVLGDEDISSKTNIEFFSDEQMKKLKSPYVSRYKKESIVSRQLDYLKILGITIPNKEILKCTSKDDIINYLSFLNQDDVRKYIPSEDLISFISSTREKKYEEAIREYYTTRKDFIDAIKKLDNNQNIFEYIYNVIKKKKDGINNIGNDNDDFLSIMFYTVHVFDGGYLFHKFVHECGHVIDRNKTGGGFDNFDVFEKNPYNNVHRKYEIFNETINDMFTIEASKYLQSKGIYLIEPKELTSLDTSDCNTSSLVKSLLQPLVQKFKKQVAKAKITLEPQELIKYIGKDNYEELVDVVNKVNFLCNNGLGIEFDNSSENLVVREYNIQLERVKQIYINIDNYYVNKFGVFPKNEFEESVIKR